MLAWGILAFSLDWLNDAVVDLSGLYGSDFAWQVYQGRMDFRS